MIGAVIMFKKLPIRILRIVDDSLKSKFASQGSPDRPPFIIVILVIVKIVLKIERRIRYFTESIRRMVCKVEDLFQKIKNVSLQYSLYYIAYII